MPIQGRPQVSRLAKLKQAEKEARSTDRGERMDPFQAGQQGPRRIGRRCQGNEFCRMHGINVPLRQGGSNQAAAQAPRQDQFITRTCGA